MRGRHGASEHVCKADVVFAHGSIRRSVAVPAGARLCMSGDVPVWLWGPGPARVSVSAWGEPGTGRPAREERGDATVHVKRCTSVCVHGRRSSVAV